MCPRAVGSTCKGPMWSGEEHAPSLLSEHTILSAERIDGSLSVHPGRKKVKDASSMHGDELSNIPQVLPLAELHLRAEKIHCQASETQVIPTFNSWCNYLFILFFATNAHNTKEVCTLSDYVPLSHPFKVHGTEHGSS